MSRHFNDADVIYTVACRALVEHRMNDLLTVSEALELVFENGFDKCNVFNDAFASRAENLFQDDVSRLVMEMTMLGMTLQ